MTNKEKLQLIKYAKGGILSKIIGVAGKAPKPVKEWAAPAAYAAGGVATANTALKKLQENANAKAEQKLKELPVSLLGSKLKNLK